MKLWQECHSSLCRLVQFVVEWLVVCFAGTRTEWTQDEGMFHFTFQKHNFSALPIFSSVTPNKLSQRCLAHHCSLCVNRSSWLGRHGPVIMAPADVAQAIRLSWYKADLRARPHLPQTRHLFSLQNTSEGFGIICGRD